MAGVPVRLARLTVRECQRVLQPTGIAAGVTSGCTMAQVNTQYNAPGAGTPVGRQRPAQQAAPGIPVPSVGVLL